MIKIDKNIPVPETRGKGNIKYPFKEMNVGDSFYIKTTKKQVGLNTRNLGKDVKFVSRKVEGGFRVWRIK